MMVKKTCRNRFTAFISTARRYSHASPDIIWDVLCYLIYGVRRWILKISNVSGSIRLLVGCRHERLREYS